MENVMKERPILFNAAMVQALLNGTKTQTRRTLKVQPDEDGLSKVTDGPWVDTSGKEFACPYGQPGEQLWVREEHYRFGHWEAVPGVRTKGGRQKWKFVADSSEMRYDAPEIYRKGRHHHDPATPAWHKRLARFMPRAASRIQLEITCVRVERLQDISEQDAKAEGIFEFSKNGLTDYVKSNVWETANEFSPNCFIGIYALLWESINGPGSWAANPWVWVIEFRRVKP